ncbi:MAG TPA: ABC transporter permease [Longimicrobiales bacterium]|nr:ABC transporter permease [Longimicrobiales bacterium]
MTSFLHDLRFGFRLLRKNPWLTLSAVVALTLGIGLTATMFSIVYGALLRGLPYEDGDRIMHMLRSNPSEGIERMGVPIHDFTEWREQQRSFEDLAAYYTGTVNVSGEERAERYDGAFISANAFRQLGVRPILGRAFREEEDSPSSPPVVLLGYDVWRNRFHADRRIIGRTIRANGLQATVVGVMPPRFRFPETEEIWLPLRLDALKVEWGEGQQLSVFGRLKPGVSLDAANVELSGLAKRIAAEHPETNKGVTATARPFIDDFIGDEPRALLWTMMGAVFLVLLIACANVANLLVSRAALRAKEVGVRTALGASRGRILGLFVTESLALAIVGALAGLGLAAVGVRAFNRAIASTNPPSFIDIRVDGVLVLFAAAMAAFAAVVSASIPALQASRADVNEILKDEARGSSSFRMGKLSGALVIGEIALSCGLLVAAGLTVRSIVRLRSIDYGFDTTRLFTARVGLPEATYADSARRALFWAELQRRLRALPGVEQVSLTTSLPAASGSMYSPFAKEGAAYAGDRDYPRTHVVAIGTGFFDALGSRVLDGRDFAERDGHGGFPVAIVNATFARKYFPGESPIGRRVRAGGRKSEAPWRTIVGVVPDLYADGVRNRQPEALYIPAAQDGSRFMSIVARTHGAPTALAGPVRDAVTALDADLPIYFVSTLARDIAKNTWFYRVFGTLFMVFGGAALFLAAIGLYAVMAFSVSRRTREVGVRMALGAGRSDVLRLVLRQGLRQIGIGLAIGIALSLGLTRLLATILFGVEPRDPTTLAAIVVVLTLTGMLACLLPARRAARVDPMAALRYE